jgi:2-polyprenyl-6-methoxyphenol hydroxylase-like FAD-dependent oxidoreductase
LAPGWQGSPRRKPSRAISKRSSCSTATPCPTYLRRVWGQARHTHGLLAGGCRALECLFPGIELDLVEAGAIRMRMRRDARYEVPGFDPFPQRDLGLDQFLLSRPALELVCRRWVERERNIEFRPRMRVTELTASPDNRGVAGVRFEDTRGTLRSLAADLVVDASGRASPTLRFLEAISSAKPAQIEIGVDQAYATAIFEMPDDAPADWLGVLHQPTPPGSSRWGLLMPIEGRRWSVSLCVNHGEAPPGDIEGFMAFAKSFRMPTIYNAIRSAKRVGDIARFGMPCSVRRAFDKLDRFPRGLVPLGDSVCRFPPVQGQGMSVAAQECCVLASLLESRRGAIDPLGGLAESFFAEIQPLLETPWAVAMADLVYPQTRGERPPDFEERLQYTRALMRLAAEDAETDRVLFEVRALLRPWSALREPELASRVVSMMAPA